MKKLKAFSVSLLIIVFLTLTGCGSTLKKDIQDSSINGRVFYEIFVRSFNDSNGDGIGDLNGITEKIDYIKDMGYKGIWLMPINESPSYHGYDVSNYYKINPQYGTMDDLKELINVAHKNDIKIIMDLVINHTSTENEWFKSASQDKNSKYRNYYLWTEDEDKINEISPLNTQAWNNSQTGYYYALFWEGMPDLNYDNVSVRDEVKKIAKFYLDMGIDGFRLDAAKWIYNDDNKNIEWWNEFNDYVKSINKNATLVGEVWDSTVLVNRYMDSLDSCFDFKLGEIIIRDIYNGDLQALSSDISNDYAMYDEDKILRTSPFLTNHDQDRVMSKLNDINKAKAAAAVLLTLPGNPYVYYGEETGMSGTKPDENIREPFIWNNSNLSKNTSWEKNVSDIDKVAVNIQEQDKNSLLNTYKDLINLRNKNEALKYGEFEPIKTKNKTVAAYKRVKGDKEAYIYISLSDEQTEEDINLNKINVLYSNKREKGKIKLEGKLKLYQNEILIVEPA